MMATLLTFIAICGYVNHRYARFPPTIGHMSFALLLSLLAIIGSELGYFDLDSVTEIVNKIDFSQVVLHGMLSFLLFAGALHINLNDWPT